VSRARFWYFAGGFILLAVYLYVKEQRYRRIAGRLVVFIVGALPTLYIGSALPDWDVTLFSIGAHRHPLFHSALPYFFVGYLSHQLRLLTLMHTLGAAALVTPGQIGFALGLASHLLLDIVQYGDVRWIPGGTLDRLWLVANAGLLLLLAWKPQYVSASHVRLRRFW
jgi:hypothetical protein